MHACRPLPCRVSTTRCRLPLPPHHPPQVYGIIAAQLALTAAVAAVVVANPGVQRFMVQSWGVQVGLLLASMLLLIPLYLVRAKHPQNLLVLGVWTALFSGKRVRVEVLGWRGWGRSRGWGAGTQGAGLLAAPLCHLLAQ